MRGHLSDVAASAVSGRAAPSAPEGDEAKQVALAAARLAQTADFQILLAALRASAVEHGGVPNYVADTGAPVPVTFDQLAPFCAVRAGQRSVVDMIDLMIARGAKHMTEGVNDGRAATKRGRSSGAAKPAATTGRAKRSAGKRIT